LKQHQQATYQWHQGLAASGEPWVLVRPRLLLQQGAPAVLKHHLLQKNAESSRQKGA
jgi:hypothetical protein